MISVHWRSAAVILAATLVACAPLEWRKPGAGAAVRDNDLAECQAQARLKAQREAPLFGLPRPPVVAMDDRGRAVTGQAARHDTERALLENDLVRLCMTERGYALAPAEQP